MDAIDSIIENQSARLVDWAIGLALGLICFAMYWSTLCPTVFWYDSAEYVTAAVTLGIPHPPGYPLYTLIGYAFTSIFHDPAYGLNLMSAFWGGLAVMLSFIVLRQIGASRVAAAIGAGTLGLNRLFWSQCIIAEVYIPNLCMILAVLLLLLRGLKKNRGSLMIFAAGLAGLALGIHLSIATCGLGFAIAVWGLGLPIQRPHDLIVLLQKQQIGRRIKITLACLGAALLGSGIFIYVPLRASMNPALNFTNPSTLPQFLWFVTGGNYKNWWLHDYSFSQRALQIVGIFYEQLLVVGLILSLMGLIHLFRRQSLIALSLGLMLAGNIYFFFNYKVHDIEVFFLPSVLVLCLLVGLGAQSILNGLDKLLQDSHKPWILRFARPVLALFPLSLVLANYQALDLSQYTAARDYGEKLSAKLPREAVIINFTTPPEWKNDAVFTHYFQKVLHRRLDVKVNSGASALDVLHLLQRGTPVYLFYPVSQVLNLFEVVKEGEVYRVVRPHPR